MVSFSYSGSSNPFKRMRKHFMAPKRVLWCESAVAVTASGVFGGDGFHR